MILNAWCLEEEGKEDKLRAVDLEIVTSDNLWVRSHEEKYNERKELAGKNTEVSKQYVRCPI